MAEPHLLEGVRMGVDSIGEKVIFSSLSQVGFHGHLGLS